jgi:hypothetical protein
MTPLLSFEAYPHLYQAILKHDLYSSSFEYNEMSLESSPETIPPAPPIKDAMTSSLELASRSQKAVLVTEPPPVAHPNHETLGSIICKIFCCCLRKKQAHVLPEAIDTSLLKQAPTVVDQGLLVQKRPVENKAEFTLRPELDEARFSLASSETAYNHASPRALAETHIDDVIRARAETEPCDISILAAVLFWRQSMIKDTILPSNPACEIIIKDNNFHELLILKNLFFKPENRDQFRKLKPALQRTIASFDSAPSSLLFDTINRNLVVKPPRFIRAHTDPTLVGH